MWRNNSGNKKCDGQFPEKKKYFRNQLCDYDEMRIVYSDNHKTMEWEDDITAILNCI